MHCISLTAAKPDNERALPIFKPGNSLSRGVQFSGAANVVFTRIGTPVIPSGDFSSGIELFGKIHQF